MGQQIMPPAIPTLTIGGRVFTDLTNLITAHAYSQGATNRRSSFRKSNTTVDYAPSGKTFKVLAWRITWMSSAAAINTLTMGYNDTALGLNSSTALTNAVQLGGGVVNAIGTQQTSGFQSPGLQEGIVDFTVPAGKYLYIETPGASTDSVNVQVWGYEV